MKAIETSDWSFTEPIDDSSEIKCSECNEFSPLSEWKLGEVECEDCGDHPAMICPQPGCTAYYDHVYYGDSPMEVRDPKPKEEDNEH